MTSKEALEIILKHVSNLMVEGKSDIYLEEIVKAKEVLKKPVQRDTPMKVKKLTSIDFGYCPNCSKHGRKSEFCSVCGQRLDWS